MCTLGAARINGSFRIFKTRDRERGLITQVIRGKGKPDKLLIVDQKGHCEGMNKYGIGLIAATLKPFPYIRHRKPSDIALEVLDQKNICDALNVVEKRKISGNMIISDGKDAYLVESTPYAYAHTKLKNYGAITNLSIKLDKRNGSHSEISRNHARTRYKRAKKLVKTISSIKDIKAFLADKKNAPKSICRKEVLGTATRCAYIYDLKRKRIFFCDTSPDKGSFKKYVL